MKGNTKEEYPGGYRRHGKSKRRAARGRAVRILAACGCLAVLLVLAGRFWGVLPLRNMPSPSSLSDTGTGGSGKGEDSGAEGGADLDDASWSLILVNRWNPIPDGYSVELTTLSNGERVDSRIYPALQEMFDDARAGGVWPIVASGYRTAAKQQGLLDEKIAEYENEGLTAGEAKRKAEEWVAVPGTSEHELGIAVDINADGALSTGDEVYGWLSENAYKYGFIRRYPVDKKKITGVINEPWHYRYVGRKAAAKIEERGICLEEYLGKVR